MTPTCPRCGSRALPGVRCHQCMVESEKTLALIAGMRRFADVLVWFEVQAWDRWGRERGDGSWCGHACAMVIVANHRRLAGVRVA